ncbi:MAG: cystathionine gamma-lyase, partial [Paracoccaceae bacterium]
MIRNDDPQRRFADLLHHRAHRLAKGDPVAPGIISATTYHLPETAGAPFAYGRMSTPTWEELEEQLAILEAAPCVGFPSGMAAISAALFATLKAGDRLIIPSDGYYVTRVLGTEFLKPLGIQITEVPTTRIATFDLTGAAVVYLETPSNPGLDLCDIALVAANAHAAGALVIVDNTTMTPLLQRPLDLGADLVVAADTKAPAGHSDVLFGHVAGRDASLMKRIRDWRRISGAVPGAFEAWLVHRGIETLEVRLDRMCRSAEAIAQRLSAHPRITALRYPGLPSDPSHALANKQMSGYGFLLTFTLEDEARAEAFLAACPYIAQTTSFGGTHTAGERRARWGDPVAPGFIRLSIGCEPLEPLWEAIAAALNAN